MNGSWKHIVTGLTAALAVSGCAVSAEESAQHEATGSVEQPLAGIDLCSETGVAAHATIGQVDVFHTSPNDQYVYGAISCHGYIVEYTDSTDANQQTFSAGWHYEATSAAECQRLRASYTLYSYSNGTWTTNGTTTFHGEWGTGGFNGCFQTRDSSTPFAQFSAGTKWRVRVAAWDRSCVGDTCTNDYKRVFSWLREPPQ